MEAIPKIQINGQVRTNARNEVIEKSILLNIREDNLIKAVQLFNQLNDRINSNLLPNPDQVTVNDIFPDEEKQPEDPAIHNWPFSKDGPTPQCPDCGSQMVIHIKNRIRLLGMFSFCERMPGH